MSFVKPMSHGVTTSRLRLRPWQGEDAAVLRDLWVERDLRVPATRRIGDDGRPSVADLRAGIVQQTAERERIGIGLLAVELLGDRVGERTVSPAPIGYCGLVVGDGSVAEPEIAFEILRAHQRRGYATEAARAVVDLARESGRRRLGASVWEWNEPSLRMLERLGFVDSGRVHDAGPHGESRWLTLDLLPGRAVDTTPAPKVVVMGVSGSGKTTVGRALAAYLQAEFVEGDDLHPQANRDKMTAGEALTDDDRWPWLDRVAEALEQADGPVVASCSSLKRAYRDRIRATAPSTFFVHLDGDPDLLRARQAGRKQHFMPASLMTSQLETLEPLQPDEAGVRLDVAAGPDALVAQASAALTG